MYTVYILQSQMDQSFYIGYTSDISVRIEEHNSGRTRYTSHKRPWKVVYQEHFQDKKTALKREIFLKKQKNRDFYFTLILLNVQA
jgi:putative endonuclease